MAEYSLITIALPIAVIICMLLCFFWLLPWMVQRKTAGRAVMRSGVLSAICGAIALLAVYFICGHVFLHLHGMGQWPVVLLIVGMIVIAFAALPNARRVMASVVAGYIIGFWLGMQFGRDIFHPERGPLGSYTNNSWLVWTVAYLVIIFAGIVWEILARRRKSRA